MTAIDFPNTPSVNDTFTASGRTWTWTGAVWAADATDITAALADKADATNPEFTVEIAPTPISGATASTDGAGYYTTGAKFSTFIYYGDSENRFAVNDTIILTATSSGTFTNVPFKVTAVSLNVEPSEGQNGNWQLDLETLTVIATSSTNYYGTTPSALVSWAENYGAATVTVPGSSATISSMEILKLDGLASNAQEQLDSKAPIAQGVYSINGSTYTITSSDAGKLLYNMNALTVTVQGLSVGQQVDFFQYGASKITFAAGSGVTLYSKGSKLKTAGQYSPASVKCIANSTYLLVGDLGD